MADTYNMTQRVLSLLYNHGIVSDSNSTTAKLVDAILQVVFSEIENSILSHSPSYDPTPGTPNLDAQSIMAKTQAELYGGGTVNEAMAAMLRHLCTALEARMTPLIEAVQLVGNHIAAKEMHPGPEFEPTVVPWDCYCGSRNPAGKTCPTCDRLSP